MASMRDIKRRKSSIQSTQQITKAMKLVSAVKLQRLKLRAEHSKAYFQAMYRTVGSILARGSYIAHPYVTGNDSMRKAIVMITGNRGLTGGYNSNMIKLIMKSAFEKETLDIYAIGAKGRDALVRKGYQMKSVYRKLAEEPSYEEVKKVSEQLLSAYKNGEVGEIYLAYTSFENTVKHEPKLMKLLPVAFSGGAEMQFEPEEEEVLEFMIPQYIRSLIFGALLESIASENGARMQAMDAATGNAEEMIEELSVFYNRARQGAVTQELTEIIAGSDAIS